MNKKVNELIIGSRSSQLALWQANYVKRELSKKNKGLDIKIKLIKTKGDKILDVALSKIGDKGLFTKEIETFLLDEEIDIAVHSLKDLQTQIPEKLILAAVTKRHHVEDVLISKKKNTTIEMLKEGAVVATGSLRRRSQLKHLRPDIKVVELRGNVPTRIEKFLDSDWDAIILARAGVERLKLNKYVSSIINSKLFLPAVGQGALGIECRKDNILALDKIKSIHHEDTFSAVLAERSFLRFLEGGCQVPIGAFAEVKSNGLYLDGYVGSVDGSISFRKKIRGSKINPEKLGKKLAKDMLKVGAGEILNEIYEKARKRK